MNYTYTTMMKSLFAKQLDVTNMQLFWQFAENDLLDGLYWETWYAVRVKNVNFFLRKYEKSSKKYGTVLAFCVIVVRIC